MPTVKALTLTQPWASLMYLLEKKNETRGWGTEYRGPLAIHAAKGYKPADEALFYNSPFFGAFQKYGIEDFQDLPRGSILCILWLKAIDKVDEKYKLPAPPELLFGDYSRGRKIWSFENQIRRFKDPLPAKGKQSLWDFYIPDYLWVE